MTEPALKITTDNQKKSDNESKKRDSTARVRETHTQEIIFALCGFMGSNIQNVADKIQHVMENDYEYSCERIKISDFIKKNRIKQIETFSGTQEYKRKKFLIENGNELRKNHCNELLAELAIQKIGSDRYNEADKSTQEDKSPRYKSRKKCIIIDSLKNPNELRVLKEVYRDLLYFIGIFSPKKMRQENLRQKGCTESEIVDLMSQDYHEEINHGQDVRELFIKADYFLRIDNDSLSSLESKISRFINLIFGTEIITPTNDETAMYFASSAASNSACLSRQVGASIFDSRGNLISVGWNDVPCYKGDLYKQQQKDCQGENDFRCLNYQNGKCMKDDYINIISENLLNDLSNSKCINEEKKDDALNIIKKSKLSGLTEFSRSVHAEMHAIIIGSQKTSEQMKGGKLYCTTYPCHNCARHIVLAGIIEVYFIEPYTKSLALKLHSDSITEDENEANKVKLLMYDGVSPNRYIQLFKMDGIVRKDEEGILIRPKKKEAIPRFTETLEALNVLESTAIRNIKDYNLNIN